VETPLD
jgi:hypothetical protein